MEELPVDLKAHVMCAVKCLEAMLPACRDAGILTSPIDAYDEWDSLVAGVYDAFLLLPVQETHFVDASDFDKIGFELDHSKRHFAVTFRGNEYTLKDFVNHKDEQIGLEVVALGETDPSIIIEEPSEISDCRIV